MKGLMESVIRNPPSVFREYMRLQRMHADVGLTTDEHRRWIQLKRALGRHFSPGLTNDRLDERGSVRVPTRLRVHFSTVDDLGRCLMTNLSRGGLFVATETPCEIGTCIHLRIEVAETGEAVEVLGEVVSVGGGASLQNEELGMGVRFRNLDDAERKAIDDLYERVMQRAVE